MKRKPARPPRPAARAAAKAPKKSPRLRSLERAAGYRFQDAALAEQALRHSSAANEGGDSSGLRSYERLELLGDAVLDFLVTETAYHAHPRWREGDLSKLRGILAGEPHLAALAARLGYGKLIEMGSGEDAREGVTRPSILADVVESVLAAVYLDGGMEAARAFVERHFGAAIRQATRESLDQRNFKSRLQEVLQSVGLRHPVYRIAGESGPPHRRIFHIEAVLGEKRYEGQGFSKQTAEQAAAENALEHIGDWIYRMHG